MDNQTDKNLTTLVGDFTDSSVAYLNQVVDGSPTRFLEYPKVYLSVPSKELVTDVFQETVDVVFDGNDTLYNPITGISEFIIYVKPINQERTALGAFNRRLADNEIFRPYFCWLLEPNRSLTVQRFTISAVHVLAANSKPLTVTLYRVSDTGPTAKRFNRSTIASNPPHNVYAE